MEKEIMNYTEFGSSDEHIPDLDPDFEILQKSMGDILLECIDESPESLYSCPVCGMEVTEFELEINGACPGCDTKRQKDDVPF